MNRVPIQKLHASEVRVGAAHVVFRVDRIYTPAGDEILASLFVGTTGDGEASGPDKVSAIEAVSSQVESFTENGALPLTVALHDRYGNPIRRIPRPGANGREPMPGVVRLTDSGNPEAENERRN